LPTSLEMEIFIQENSLKISEGFVLPSVWLCLSDTVKENGDSQAGN
jgi:hypothetical protein